MERVDTIGDEDDDDDEDDADSEEEEVISTLISSARSAASKCAALREDGGVENFISTTQNVIRNEELEAALLFPPKGLSSPMQ